MEVWMCCTDGPLVSLQKDLIQLRKVLGCLSCLQLNLFPRYGLCHCFYSSCCFFYCSFMELFSVLSFSFARHIAIKVRNALLRNLTGRGCPKRSWPVLNVIRLHFVWWWDVVRFTDGSCNHAKMILRSTALLQGVRLTCAIPVTISFIEFASHILQKRPALEGLIAKCEMTWVQALIAGFGCALFLLNSVPWSVWLGSCALSCAEGTGGVRAENSCISSEEQVVTRTISPVCSLDILTDGLFIRTNW